MGSTALMSTNEKKEDHYFYLLFFLFFISFIYWSMFINSFFMRPIKSKRVTDEKSNKDIFFFLQNRFFTAFAKSERDFISSKCFFMYWYMKTWKAIKTLLMSPYFSRFDFRSAQTLAAIDVIGSVLLSNIWPGSRIKSEIKIAFVNQINRIWRFCALEISVLYLHGNFQLFYSCVFLQWND